MQLVEINLINNISLTFFTNASNDVCSQKQVSRERNSQLPQKRKVEGGIHKTSYRYLGWGAFSKKYDL